MAYIQSLGTGGVDKMRLYLYGKSHSSAYTFGYSFAAGSVEGNGTYKLQNVFISKVTCVSGSMKITYDNEQNTSVTTTLSQGQTILINNNSGVIFSWSSSKSYSGSGLSTDSWTSGEVTSNITVDVFF